MLRLCIYIRKTQITPGTVLLCVVMSDKEQRPPHHFFFNQSLKLAEIASYLAVVDRIHINVHHLGRHSVSLPKTLVK